MATSTILLAMIVAAGTANSIPKVEAAKQHAVFDSHWNEEFVWKFDELPTKGGVPEERIPYSGYIYLDKFGGTMKVLRKYDRAFNSNRGFPATSWEASDTAEGKKRSGGLFRARVDNGWFGHCNGWTSAAIRHAEPQKSVWMNGVEFTPADIKGLLAEVYIYNHHEVLAGLKSNLNPGTFHAILANWLGRGSHPIAMDSDTGEEIWNYPIYAFASSASKHSEREVEIRTNMLYAKDTEDQEYDESPRYNRTKSFHYMLELDARGNIVGGYYFRDSDRIDFVWVPFSAKQSAAPGNESGNPHMDVAKVMDIWRRSVSKDVRRRWLVVDLPDKDRAVEVEDPSRMLPRNIRIVPRTTRTAGANDLIEVR